MERHKRCAHFDKPAARVHVCDIAHLQVADIQQFSQFQPVGAGLVQHDNKFAVGKHCPGGMALEHIVLYANEFDRKKDKSIDSGEVKKEDMPLMHIPV